MRWLVVCLLALPVQAGAAGMDTNALLKGVENHYNRARTLQVLFEQTYTIPGRSKRLEQGELFLRKPGRMRWVYSVPAGKLFVSDGKTVYLYTPASNQVQRQPLRESDDFRAPLGFLLGKLNFWRDFDRFVSKPEGEDVRIAARPKSERALYTDVEFVVTPSLSVRYLRIVGQDHSVMEFRFSEERINPPLAESLFRFEAPPGAEVVDAIEEIGETP